MLPAMFGMGGSEIMVILVVALLFLGPDKLPDAAKTISKGIRDIKKQSRALQQQIENDEQIGGAIRDLKSALRGEDAPPRARRSASASRPRHAPRASRRAEPPRRDATAERCAEPARAARVTLPETAGEADPDATERR